MVGVATGEVSKTRENADGRVVCEEVRVDCADHIPSDTVSMFRDVPGLVLGHLVVGLAEEYSEGLDAAGMLQQQLPVSGHGLPSKRLTQVRNFMVESARAAGLTKKTVGVVFHRETPRVSSHRSSGMHLMRGDRSSSSAHSLSIAHPQSERQVRARLARVFRNSRRVACSCSSEWQASGRTSIISLRTSRTCSQRCIGWCARRPGDPSRLCVFSTARAEATWETKRPCAPSTLPLMGAWTVEADHGRKRAKSGKKDRPAVIQGNSLLRAPIAARHSEAVTTRPRLLEHPSGLRRASLELAGRERPCIGKNIFPRTSAGCRISESDSWPAALRPSDVYFDGRWVARPSER